jgi:calcineurin-like phosphoesterase family protein
MIRHPIWPAILSLALVGCAAARPPVVATGDVTPKIVAAEPGQVEATVFLIGDAGAPVKDEPVFAALKRQVSATPGKRVIVFLGDNVYLRGLPDTNGIGRGEAERRLDEQIAVALETRVETYFIPGNHDWEYMGPGGWSSIKRQNAYIEQKGAPFARMVPSGGCPGPEYVDPSPHLRLIMLDTQWWLHDYDRPRDSTSNCPFYTAAGVVNALNRELLTAADRNVVVMGHHPLASGGPHGGELGWTPHLFPLLEIRKWLYVPLPIIGSYYTLNREQGASDQDLSGPKNERMRRALEMVLALRKPLVYASGHDHGLQVLDGKTARHLLVSGAGIINHEDRVSWIAQTRYASSLAGFMRLDFLKDRRVRLGVETVDAKAVITESYAEYLK